jgi:hypothetical protein
MKCRVMVLAFCLICVHLCSSAANSSDDTWIDLTASNDFSAFTDASRWQVVQSVAVDKANPKRLTSEPGKGIYLCPGSARDLLTKRPFTDAEVHAEFLIPANSNSGIKMLGLYEIQITDSAKVPADQLTGDHNGGIYPRANPTNFRLIDKGFPPLVNAAKPAGEWQTLDITFTAPRFDADGKKTANAVFVKVLLNGQVVQRDRDVGTPTGANHVTKKEVPSGPLLLQGDHGPIAFRNVRIRPLGAAK